MLSKFHEKQGEEGFTLIELLVVIIIIGILAAIAIPTFLGQRERARRSAVQSDLRNLAVAQETYFTDNGFYSDSAAGLEFKESANVTITIVTGTATEFCASAAIDGLPAVDGAAWYFDSDDTTNPQLRPFTTAGCL